MASAPIPGEAAAEQVSRAARTYASLSRLTALTDLAGLAVASYGAWAIPRIVEGSRSPAFGADHILFPLFTLGALAVLRVFNLSTIAPADEFRRIPAAVVLGMGSLLVVSFWQGWKPSHVWVVSAWLLGLLATLASHRLWHWWLGRARVSGRLQVRTLIVGTNAEARRIAADMRRSSLGFLGVGFVSVDGNYVRLDDLPVWDLGALRGAIGESGAESLFVASSDVAAPTLREIRRAVRDTGIEIRISAQMTETLSSRLTIQPIGRRLVLSLRPVRLSGPQATVKRTFDIAVAGFAILLTLPIWLVVAGLVRLTSPGPVLYRQRRVGRGGRIFTMYKFRTMVDGAERMLEALLEANEADGPLFKVRADPRLTVVGRHLRRWSLDELPQLLNVLKGDMSLVGPRPPLPEEVEAYRDWQRDRMVVRPGMSGLWQVSGRSNLTFEEAVRLDLFYIENWSLGYDLFVLLKTLPAVLARRGAY